MLDRFIFCPCSHTLEAHSNQGCSKCTCAAVTREVIDGLLEVEREAIHRTWLGCAPSEPALRSGTAVER